MFSASSTQVFSRRDQLSMRSAKKTANKENKGKGKGAKNKRNTKEKNKGEETVKATRKSRAKPEQSQDEKPAPKRAAAKRKAAKKPAGPRKSKSRKVRFDQLDLDVTQDVVQQDEIANWIWDNNVDYSADLDNFKRSVQTAKTKFEYFRHNVYWTTFKCGLTMYLQDGTKKDVATFHFSDDQRGLATAVACADYVAAWTWQCWLLKTFVCLQAYAVQVGTVSSVGETTTMVNYMFG